MMLSSVLAHIRVQQTCTAVHKIYLWKEKKVVTDFIISAVDYILHFIITFLLEHVKLKLANQPTLLFQKNTSGSNTDQDVKSFL